MKSASELASELLSAQPGGLEELRVHEFADDESAHDDQLIQQLLAEFSADFDRVQDELSRSYGVPVRTGTQDDDVIPLNGVFRFAVWQVGEAQLYAAAAHEDRGVPMLLMLGTIDTQVG